MTLRLYQAEKVLMMSRTDASGNSVDLAGVEVITGSAEMARR